MNLTGFTAPLPVRVSGDRVAAAVSAPKCALSEKLYNQNVPNRRSNAQLPQFATSSETVERIKELNGNRDQYVYKAPEAIPGIAFLEGPVEDLPSEKPSRAWQLKALLVRLRRELNFLLVDGSALRFAIRNLFRSKPYTEEAQRALSMAVSLAKRFDHCKSDFEEMDNYLRQYRNLFKIIKMPEIANHFMEDEVFADLRTAGFNPMTLFAVTDRAAMPFEFTDAEMPGDDTVQRAIEENRLFALDFSALAGLEQEAVKYFAVAKALFVVPPGEEDATMVPLAIEMDGEIVKPPATPVCERTPGRWDIAKLAVNVCDGMHHQLFAHLCSTHLMLEPFVAATMRQLAKNHPIRMLLRPHFEGTAFINESAIGQLVVKKGPVDRVLAGELDSGLAAVTTFMQALKFNSGFPDVEMERRGVTTKALRMPYRDDALEHWAALREFTFAYVSHFYKSSADLDHDVELQAWAAELVDPERGRVNEFGDRGDGRIRSVRYLADAVAYVIFMSSVQHAAVNSPQGSTLLYSPATPGFLWGRTPEMGEYSPYDSWRLVVSPLQNAIEQMDVLFFLGSVQHTTLGKYRRNELPNDKEVRDALQQYKERLRRLEKTIEAREQSNPKVLKYEFLKPSNVPQSTNI